MFQGHMGYLRYFVGSQRALRHPWRIDRPLCPLTHDVQVKSMALLCPCQEYLPRLEAWIDFRHEHKIGLRRPH